MHVAFTAEDVAREAIRLAEQYPNAVYTGILTVRQGDAPSPACCYLRGRTLNGPPNRCGCLFGQAIQNLAGDNPEVIEKLQQADATLRGLGIDSLLRGYLGMTTVTGFQTESGSLATALKNAQGQQDHGRTWREAAEPLRTYFALLARTQQETTNEP